MSRLITANYTDPAYEQLRQQFGQRSSEYPVALLPVRLETKFMNETRIKRIRIPGLSQYNAFLKSLYTLHYEVEKALAEGKALRIKAVKAWVNSSLATLTKAEEDLTKLRNLSGGDKKLLRQALAEVEEDLKKLGKVAPKVKPHIAPLQQTIQELNALVDKIAPLKSSVYEPGYRYLRTLEEIEKSIDTLFYKREISASALDTELDAFNDAIKSIEEQIQQPDFRATEGTIAKIRSKVSYIKRRHKKSPISLTAYKKSYTGKRNLATYNHVVKTKLDTLKKRVEQQHLPFMEIGEKLQRFPVRQLKHRISRAYWYLKAQNERKALGYDSLMAAKEELYDQLLSIRNRAHRPLEGSYTEINDLKTSYGQLEREIQRFLQKAAKLKPQDRYQKAALTRLHTHLTEEYLTDLQDLLPDHKPLKEQVFSDFKLRTTTTAASASAAELQETAGFLKNIRKSDQNEALYLVNKRLEDAKNQITKSASNTHLLPRQGFLQLQNQLNSLRSNYRNALKNNMVAKSNPEISKGWEIIEALSREVENQQVDVFDQKDRFYDDYRKRITFITQSETIKELWVRIFPDDIAINNHNEQLTASEIQVSKDYYYEVYSRPEADREDAKLGAWRAAAASMGIRRAAYALAQLLPDELKNNGTVPERQNDLAEFWRETGYFLPGNQSLFKNRFQPTPAAVDEVIKSLVQNLKTNLQSQVFNPCVEHKNTLLTVRNGLNNTLSFCQNALRHEKDPATIKMYLTWQDQLEQAVVLLRDYYQDHKKAFEIPFRANLSFDEPEPSAESWSKAVTSEVLPDRFVVATMRGGNFQHIVTGKALELPLQVGFDPSGDQAERWFHDEKGDLQVPDELSWMFDFEKAVDAGLGIRIPLQDEDFQEGFETVLCLGVRNTSALSGQQDLEKLLTSHLYSDGGLEFLPVDTPTNNTDTVKSAYSALDDDFDAAFDLFMGDENLVEVSNSVANELNISDGQLFKEALGLNKTLVGNMRHFAKKEIAEGRAMNRALINATLKYFMAVMARNLVNKDDIKNTVPFVVQHLSALGNLPSIRIDEQPYGVLPITATDLFREGNNLPKGTTASYVQQLSYTLRSMKEIFEGLPQGPGHVNSTRYHADPQAEFLKILGLAPHSQEFYYRAGSNVAKRWETPEDIDFPLNWDNNEPNTPANLAQHFFQSLRYGLGIESPVHREKRIENSRAYTNRFFEAGFINGSLVQDPKLGRDKLADIDENTGNYLNWLKQIVDVEDDDQEEGVLRRLDFNAIPAIDHEDGPIKQNTLLLLMVRGGLIYDRSSFALNAIEHIKHLSVPKLERLLANHLDLCSYRLDAWLSALADYRLKNMREQQSSGTYLGAYGFVTDLKPAETRERVQNLPDRLAPADGGDVFKAPENQGFVHGPSLNHAVTAAVLRAGYNSLRKKGNTNNALAVNLSSARVRKALFLMEGVSRGQEIGALLGYQMERALHDKYTNASGQPLEMDVYIYRLRRKFPTYSNRSAAQATDTSVSEQLRPTNVLDGLAMIDYFEQWLQDHNLFNDDATFVEMMIDESGAQPVFPGHPWGLNNEVPDPGQVPTGSSAAEERKKLKALIYELDNMADAFDAMADLTTAEGVYQLVRGNHVRAGAVLKAMADGTRPVDPEIIKSIRQGTSVTHRAILSINLQTGNPWPTVGLTPRAKASPELNNWLAQQLGAPENTEWQARVGDTISYLNLGDLGMQPIDWVMLVAQSSEDNQAELQSRCVDYLQSQGAAADSEIILNFNSASNSTKFSLGEQMALLQHLGQTIAKARPADARDYREEGAAANNEPGALGIDLGHFETRITTALNDYRSLLQTLSTFNTSRTNFSAAEIDLAREKLRELSEWGFSGYYPAQNASIEENVGKLQSAQTLMSQQLNWAEQQLEELEFSANEMKWLQFGAELASKLFGNGFKLMPRIQLDNSLAIQQQRQLPHADGPLRHHPENGYLEQWLSTTALVRTDLAAPESARLLGDALHQNTFSFKPIQLPFDASVAVEERDFWLGADYPATHSPAGDRLSLLCFGVESIQDNCLGLVLDEWMELIPDEEQTTGIAFHFNQPDARAPQNILLAVPALNTTQQWDTDELLLTVHEALRQAKIRAVEPEHVDFSVLSQMLPATTTLAHGADRLDDGTDLGGFIDYSFVNMDPQTLTDE
jgi:hypothetical protein